ncbi:lysozyme [Kitasatospora cineracea]|uniref:Lysozyme n=1 Tax=Kitasatospora cineracea TaxID=88074 RepID=A0A3N4RYT5_9ACTN|nr:lysozyme [Kitasatospora cineracea]ROR45775.1 GH25 family lysozyme M1 (1,4-beta-N-acetylmuramidase) [Kitasatospora cineracea]RPE36129.1 GH25 family lysozyme M1 (1,4-beta-N-acetylmuramidase) [Kitasatospora cineracea]
MPASGTTRMLRRAATAAASAALLVGVVAAVPAQAAKPGTPANFHPEQDYAGSTVAAHEGRGDTARTASTLAALAATQTKGMDVSSYQGNVAWSTAYANGGRFAYVKATEGTSYTNAYFAQQYNGSYNAGMIRGAYHFALPNVSSGATQAAYFVAHGGGWSKDGKTLPPALDIEYNPYGATCYGLSQAGMVSWIRDFSNTVHTKTGRYPTIYTTTDWWTTCTGNNSSFGATNPLWIARYSSSVGTLPAGWSYQTIWQYADSGTLPGDQNYFNGALDRVQALANG